MPRGRRGSLACIKDVCSAPVQGQRNLLRRWAGKRPHRSGQDSWQRVGTTLKLVDAFLNAVQDHVGLPVSPDELHRVSEGRVDFPIRSQSAGQASVGVPPIAPYSPAGVLETKWVFFYLAFVYRSYLVQARCVCISYTIHCGVRVLSASCADI